MKANLVSWRHRWFRVTAILVIVGVLIGGTYPWWRPYAAPLWDRTFGKTSAGQAAIHSGHDHSHDEPHDPAHDSHEDHGHAHADGGHHHDHPGHVEEASIELSEAGLKNIGFQPATVKLQDFERTVSMPAVVVERPGRSQIHITAPLTGVVTRIHVIEGAAVEPESPMFEIRLTHEELVVAQRDFLRTAENLDVVQREIDRLRSAGEGTIAGRRILEQQYEQQKLEASLRAERQALLLHGLSGGQIDEILRSRELLQSLVVHAPAHSHEDDPCGQDHLFHVQNLPVQRGQQVNAGAQLCVLGDHCELYIEGQAFEDDAEFLRTAAREGRSITARVLSASGTPTVIPALKLLYLADRVDPHSRALRFYVRLPNEVALDHTGTADHRFITWRFNPGQRMELQVPIEVWTDRIVLPVQAVVEEGAENYVYARRGEHFDRTAVHVEYRDQHSAVIADDGALRSGDVIAGHGAYQIHLALKNKSAGGVDPHAGHQH